MRNLIFAAALTIGFGAHAQQFDFVPATTAQKEKANEVAEYFDGALGLTSKQEALVSKNYAEFIAKKEFVISSDRDNEEKNSVLKALYVEQERELNDIFTDYQRDKFKSIRSKYDPLLLVVSE
ncbi:MAG: hypothetical protein WBG46_04925 [Nonlabens sp.]